MNPPHLPGRLQGLSLLEILLSVALVGVLMAILAGVTEAGIAQAKSVACVQRLHDLGVAMNQYFSDRGHYPVLPADPNDPKAAWPWLISDYLNYNRAAYSPEVFACPAGPKHPEQPKEASRGYSMNQMVADTAYGANRFGPAAQVLLVEEWIDSPGTDRHHVMLPTLGAVKNKTYIAPLKDSNKVLLGWRHRNAMNFLRRDGSAGRSGPGADGWGDGKIVWRPIP